MCRISLLAVALLVGLSTVNGREWTDSTGQFHREAELTEYRVNEVVLKKQSGVSVVVPVERLSVADREYLGNFARETLNIDEPASGAEPAVYEDGPAESAGSNSKGRPNAAPVATLASYVEDEELAAPEDEAAAGTYAYKRIFSGCRSTFHLIHNGGTGAFWLRHHNGHCHHYLTNLKRVPPPPFALPGYVFYKVMDPPVAAHVTHIALLDQETPWCQRNPVWIQRPGSNYWHFFEWDYREVLHP
ncbi:MAG TPA: SHD1 domain-containing protein [Pirellulales bacterium]|jgi:hypothetical protein